MVSAGAIALAALIVSPQAQSASKSAPIANDQSPAAAMRNTGTNYTADADMQAVLDALASLNGKPIETLGPSEARKQPTPSDAVMAILKKQGKDTSATALVPGVTSEDRATSRRRWVH